MRIRSFCCVLVAVFVAAVMILGVWAGPSAAAVKQIWPDKFKPYGSGAFGGGTMLENFSAARQTYSYISGSSTAAAWFYAPLKVPVGSTITKLAVSAYSASAATVRGSIYRTTLGGDGNTVAEVEKVGSYVPQWFGTRAIAYPVVEPGYRYWVTVYISNGAAVVFGAKVAYE